jgi:hypothetical protein
LFAISSALADASSGEEFIIEEKPTLYEYSYFGKTELL